MNCAEVRSLSSLYLSGELDPTRSAAIAKHVATCPSCALQLQMHTDLDNLLRQAILSDHISAATLNRRVHERIADEGDLHPVRSVPRAAIIAVAAAILLLLVGGLGYRALFGMRTPTVYADAAADHHDEIIDQQPRKWISDQAAIALLAKAHGLSPSAVAALAPAGYRLECAKVCSLDGRAFLHLVFVSDVASDDRVNKPVARNIASNSPDKTQKVSLFLCPREFESLPQVAQKTTEDGKSLYTPSVGAEHLACFETKQVTALVVTDEAGNAALKFASSAAGIL